MKTKWKKRGVDVRLNWGTEPQIDSAQRAAERFVERLRKAVTR